MILWSTVGLIFAGYCGTPSSEELRSSGRSALNYFGMSTSRVSKRRREGMIEGCHECPSLRYKAFSVCGRGKFLRRLHSGLFCHQSLFREEKHALRGKELSAERLEILLNQDGNRLTHKRPSDQETQELSLNTRICCFIFRPLPSTAIYAPTDLASTSAGRRWPWTDLRGWTELRETRSL